MAAPQEVTTKDLSGGWVLNKTLSDPLEPILILQGVSWFTRKGILLATVTLHVKQYPLPATSSSPTHIDIEQTATGGIKGTTEIRTLDWEKRSHTDHIFGNLTGQSRWLTLEGITSLEAPKAYESREDENVFLGEGWLEGEEENGGPEGEKHVESFVINEEKKWTARQIWGFAIVDGKRYYVRRIVVRRIGGDECLKVKMVYNWLGREDKKEEDGLVY